MALSLKLQKEIEADIHEQLYSNIFILTLTYPTTKEFNASFKKDMFTKNNKTAYLQVVHFLLNILDPTFFKQRNMWPILDVKMEAQFRNELMKYINELNSTNKETGIPLLMTSHLISPGGYRFADFIFRFSQFVLSEHVKRETGNNIPFPPKASNNYSIASEQVRNMEKIVDDQYSTLVDKQKIFETKQQSAKESIQYILLQQPVLGESKKQIEDQIGYFVTDETQITKVFETLPQREGLIDGKLIKLESDSLVFQKCSTLIDILNENKNTVSCTVEVDNTVYHSKTRNNIDLVEYFESMLESLKNNKVRIKIRKDPNLPEYVRTSSEIVNDLSEHNDKYEELITELELYVSHLQENNSNEKNDTLHRYETLSQKIRNLFETIPPVNFSV